ncbi:MAG: hypothetical protein HN353_05150 [Bdellovibrionales bacterium]|jgi:hypothetical protein|nr:hypothetical protein [Bdellovibrionales bacterium]MBT3525035.1 hypothetical protein [Bdellovibrionales bacterium]MBT7768166.1 hypothetical protein [Bdellovibrionales bacterium]
MVRALYCHSLLISLLVVLNLSAVAASDGVRLNYPELMVTPRASTRIKLEAVNEKHRKWQTHLSVQASGLMTLTAGILQLGNSDDFKDPKKGAAYTAIIVGGGWLGVTAALAKYYTPYATGYKSIFRLKRGSPREQLLRERIAESHIERAAKMAKRLTWLSSISNGAAAVNLLSNQGEGALSGAANFLALIAAFSPVIIPYIWERVDKEQKLYKKRIYGPVVMATILPVGSNRPGSKSETAPGLLFSATF